MRAAHRLRTGVLWKGLAVLLVLWAGVEPGLAAQNPRGTLRGVVQDSSGARIPRAKVAVESAGLSTEREVETSERGEFRVDDLLPGAYWVRVEAAGFQVAESRVVVQVSSGRDIDVVLKPTGVHQEVNVSGEASSITTQPVDVASAVQQGIVTAQDLREIPLALRSFANIAFLVPGTEPVEPSDPTKARITAVATGGSSGLNNELSVDGVDNSDDYIGGFLQNFSPESIEEFAFRTSQENADTGRTTAGSVVISTRRGTDDLHGEFAFYERAAALNARFPIENPAPDPKQPFSRQNYVGTLGGAIRRGKLWFFSSFEYVHEDASIAYSPNSQNQFASLSALAAGGLIPGVTSISVPKNTPVPFNDFLGMLRLDWKQSARSQWFLRASSDSYLTKNDLIQQGTLPSTGATSHSNYLNLALGEQYAFSPTWVGTFLFGASGLHRTETRNDYVGFSLQFPFSASFRTVSGLDTFGDNQFSTAITAFPVLRNQEKYQLRYDISHSAGRHAPSFGVNFIHEPVLAGTLSGTAETVIAYPQDPGFYAANPSQFFFHPGCASQPDPASEITCTSVAASNGSFSQNVQRLGFYAQDSWRVTRRLTVNYGLRYDTTFGLFQASGRSQLQNPAYRTLQALQIPLVHGGPHDYRAAVAPRLGIAYAPGTSGRSVIRAGIGLYYNDLAQNGWVGAFRAVNTAPLPCLKAVGAPDAGCIPGAAAGGAGALIDPKYKMPYALHASVGFEHALSQSWTMGASWVHEQGVHGYRNYQYVPGFTLFTPLYAADDTADQLQFVPPVSVAHSDNRSSYDALLVHVQGNVTRRINLIANYSFSSAKTWGCILGELFDYVNGVCNPLRPFGAGDYGPSGEDVGSRVVVAGIFHAPAGLAVSLLFQAEGARPITLTTPVDVNGLGDAGNNRAVVNGVQTTLDEFRGTPYVQADLRVSRAFTFHDRWWVTPFVEFFNLFNRNNPGANYVTDLGALPTPVNNLRNATAFCLNADCSQTKPITNPKQLLVPAGALGDFFGPGTTVGIPFAAQIGIRVSF
jgi:Carboxypeptidase regulatory-like domain/TonB dependent receptor